MDTRTMKFRFPTLSPTMTRWLAVIGVIGVAAFAAVVFRNQWLPHAAKLLASVSTSGGEAEVDDAIDNHAGHNHGQVGSDEGNSLELSQQARKNIGLTTVAIKLQSFTRSVTVPAQVIGRPGRSHVEVTAPLGGRVTRVYPIEGEAVEPGQPLFDLRLTHEELVQAQSEFLRFAEQLDVELREIRRLETIVQTGAIPGKRLLERQYEKQKIEAVQNAQRQSLLLHGLTEQQIDGILQERMLVQGVTVYTPDHPKNGYDVPPTHPFTVRTLHVKPGQYVNAGAPLSSLMDYEELYIQGRAFEHDADELLQAARKGWELTATREDNNERSEAIKGLKIVYVDNEVEPESRALHFFVGLGNKIVHESESADGHRFLTWQYKPGQRMQLHVPVEQWPDRIVLPVDAVIKEGADRFVFQQNGGRFNRKPVYVEYRDQHWAVIDNDGSLFPGDVVAATGAYQMQLTMKNKAGGGVDPHAGHNH